MSKEEQNYIENPKYNTCCNCKHLASSILGETTYDKNNVGHTPIIKYAHCALGGFEIKLNATCSKHSKNTQ